MGQIRSIEDVRAVVREYDRTHPPEGDDPFVRRQRALEEAERSQQRTREVQERQAIQAQQSQEQQWQAWNDWADAKIDNRSRAMTKAVGHFVGGIRAQLRDEFKAAIDELRNSFEVELAEHKERLVAVSGKLPVSKIWCPESVTYGGEVASYDGSLYQARKDTARIPTGSDWICVARAGCDGRTPKVCGPYDVRKSYARLDIVVCDNGTSFIAKRDDPGPCPGNGWEMLAARGRSGETIVGRAGHPAKKASGASPAATAAMGKRRRLAAHTMSGKAMLGSTSSHAMAPASSRGAMIQARVPGMAGKCWRRAARPVTKVSPAHAARKASSDHAARRAISDQSARGVRGASPAHPAGGAIVAKLPPP